MRTLLVATLFAGVASAQVVVTKSTTQVSIPNCDPSPPMRSYDVDVYRPSGSGSFGLVALGHGFQLSKGDFDGLARAVAATGVVVVVPQFPLALALQCGWSDHARNSRILLAAIDQQLQLGGVDPQRVGVGGHSAGGLSAWLAAAQRPMAAVVLLDAVDNNGLGLAQVANVSAPTIFLFGEPSSCNSQTNSAAWFASKPGLKGRLKVVNANHCDPQEPISSTCTLGCGGSGATSTTRSQVFKRHALGFFSRFLNGQTVPCLDEQIAADALSGTVTQVDLQWGGCGAVDAGIDAGVAVDSGTPDAGVRDAGVPDAGIPDAGSMDAAILDAGTADAGVADSGVSVTDAGPGAVDAGNRPDAGIDDPAGMTRGCSCQTVDLTLIGLGLVALGMLRRRRS